MGIFCTGKQTTIKRLEIFTIVFSGDIFIFLYSKQFKNSKYAQIIRVNRSEQRLMLDLIITWAYLRWSEPGHEDFFYQLFRTNKSWCLNYYHLSQLVHVLDAQRFLFCNCQGTIDCMEERGLERGNHSMIFLERDGHCQSGDHWNCFTYEAHMGFSKHTDIILNWTELNLSGLECYKAERQ